MILATSVAVLAVDQVSKALVRGMLPPGKSVDLRLFLVRQVRNPGTAFGLIQGKSLPFFLASIALLLIFLVVFWKWRKEEGPAFQVALGLIIGGAVGNIVDRVFLGEVVDFIDLRFWPVFNLADVAIVCGVAIALFCVIRDIWREGEKAGEEKP